ncbi:MAG: PAS domain S-box protein [Desulfatitalea sp.]
MNQDCPRAGSDGVLTPISDRCKQCPYHPSTADAKDSRPGPTDGAPDCPLFENCGTATIIAEPDMTISMANARAAEMFGYSRQELLSQTRFIDYLTPEYHELVKLYHELVLSGQIAPPRSIECKIYHKEGSEKEVLAEIGWIAASRQTIITLVDWSDRKAAERERHSLNEIVEQSAESILLTDAHGQIVYVNAAFEELSAYTREEMVGATVDHPFFSDQDRLIFKQMSFSVASRDAGENRAENHRKDGRHITTATRIAPVCDPRGRVTHLVCNKKDITRETELEHQLYESQKMEAIGTLASGIAHDFNNIMAGILGYAEMASQTAGDPERVRRYMARVLQACERARDLSGQILSFSRHKNHEAQPVEVQTLVREALKLLRASTPSTIEFRKALTAERSVVQADPTRIHQIILNLCANAAHAMEASGGLLEVTLKNLTLPQEGQEPAIAAPPGAYIHLSVRDTGIGIDPQSLAHIFEPYYTTKASRGGTGLGLSVVQKIVRNLDGFIQVQSQVGQGTTFDVYLPRIDEQAPAKKPANEVLPRGQERILVVDDETFILEVLHDLLSTLGYQVETAQGALFALDRLNNNPRRYDLIIADLTMPHMDGKKLAVEIMKLSEQLPIILCTGMAYTLDRFNTDHPNIKALLPKPLEYEQLAVTVRKVLDGR